MRFWNPGCNPTVVRLLQWQFFDPSDKERGALVASVFAKAINAFTASLDSAGDPGTHALAAPIRCGDVHFSVHRRFNLK
jgi:hypothetical protein